MWCDTVLPIQVFNKIFEFQFHALSEIHCAVYIDRKLVCCVLIHSNLNRNRTWFTSTLFYPISTSFAVLMWNVVVGVLGWKHKEPAANVALEGAGNHVSAYSFANLNTSVIQDRRYSFSHLAYLCFLFLMLCVNAGTNLSFFVLKTDFFLIQELVSSQSL